MDHTHAHLLRAEESVRGGMQDLLELRMHTNILGRYYTMGQLPADVAERVKDVMTALRTREHQLMPGQY